MASHRARLIIRRNTVVAVFLALFFGVAGLSSAGADMSGKEMPPMPVSFEEVNTTPTRLWRDYPGRLTAIDYAEIRPQVSGRIVAIKFNNGQKVKAGDILFVIDKRPFVAQVRAAEAARDLAKAQYERAISVKSDFIAKSLVDERAATLKAAEAALAVARLNLEYAEVRAPIAGIISRAEVTVGNLVEINAGAPLLASITADNGLYADFVVDEATYVDSSSAAVQSLGVEISLPGMAPALNGTMESFDNRVDVVTGGVRARARFDTKDNALKPGLYATIRLGTPEKPLLTVSEKAIGTDQDKKFVLVVDEGNKVGLRPVTLGDSVRGRRVVLSGLKNGDKVITSGLQLLRPGMAVAPQSPASSAPTPM
ncbi:MAG: efflux RND transporter periplasmic adaptor subunit [Alphaproteobacteria bacterium]|nr:efflux RND transporter periplasmic adaptor subunit [Alphaproteobacteria bacterium]